LIYLINPLEGSNATLSSEESRKNVIGVKGTGKPVKMSASTFVNFYFPVLKGKIKIEIQPNHVQ